VDVYSGAHDARRVLKDRKDNLTATYSETLGIFFSRLSRTPTYHTLIGRFNDIIDEFDVNQYENDIHKMCRHSWSQAE